MPEPRAARRDAHPAQRTKTAAILLLAALVLCITAYAAAVRVRGVSFSWTHAMISDLGRTTCRDWNGFWVCSPRAGVFNVLVGLAGACVLIACVLARYGLARLLTAALAALGLGLVWVALFPADGAVGVHMVGGVLALPAPSVLFVLHAVRSEKTCADVTSRMLGGLGAVSAVASLDHVMPAPAPMARGVAEGVSLLALGGCLVVVALTLVWRPVARRDGEASATPSPSRREGPRNAA